ncbi:hypothetical protein SALBM311S_11003 [Streptomyces alboniger]
MPELEVSVSEPELSVSEPELSGPEPESPVPDPGSTAPDPGSTAPDPGSTAPDPESPVPEPSVPDPESAVPDPESTAPDPESTAPDPESPVPEPSGPESSVAVPVSAPESSEHGDQKQPSVVRGDGQPLALGVGDQFQHPPQLARRQAPGLAMSRRPGEIGDLDRVLALRVRHVRDLAARAEHLREPDPYPGGVGDRTGGAVPVGEPVQAPPDDDGARAARLVDRDAVHVLGGRDLVRTASRARPAQPDVEPTRYGVGGQVVDDPQVAPALVHHPAAVARRVPGVERVVVGVPAQVGAVVGAGVEVADALVVGEEGDPVADEQGGVEVAVQVGEDPLPVQPQPARGTAPVALPGGRFVRRGAGEEQGPALAVEVGGLNVGTGPQGSLRPGSPSGRIL